TQVGGDRCRQGCMVIQTTDRPARPGGGPRRPRRDQRGAAAVEFALVLPLLLILVFGIVEFGRAYSAKISLTAAAREGARLLALDGTAAAVQARVKDSAPSLNPALISFNAITSPCTPGNLVEVQASYPLAWDIPMLGSGTWTLVGRGVMRCSG
ncbi:MAG: TadE/TadG family type IV pilus assembly protein, partial [Acidimicrobiales bacterium]